MKSVERSNTKPAAKFAPASATLTPVANTALAPAAG